MPPFRATKLAAAVALACLWSLGPSAAAGRANGQIPIEDTISSHVAAIVPVSPDDAALYTQLASRATELATARARLAPLGVDVGQPRLVGTRFGWVGVQYPVESPTLPEAGQYSLWFDTRTDAVIAEGTFLPRQGAIEARIVLAGQTVVNDAIPLTRLDGDRFWECLRMCTNGALSHWLYTLVRAACSRACVPVSIYCAPCVIALSALEAGMISGCVFACTKEGPESGAWGMAPAVGSAMTVSRPERLWPVWR